MKKKILCSILILTLILSLCCGCQKAVDNSTKGSENENKNSQDNQDTQNEQTGNKSDKSIDTLISVLKGENTLYYTEDAKEMKITELNNFLGIAVDEPFKGSHFAVMNLDDDAIPEVVIELSIGDNPSLGFVILHYANDKVYGYSIGYRAFNQVKADGTFNYANSAVSNGFGKLSFSTDSYETVIIAHTDVAADNETIEYFIGDEKVTEEKYNEFIEGQEKKEDPVWFDFTEENFSSALQNFIK